MHKHSSMIQHLGRTLILVTAIGLSAIQTGWAVAPSGVSQQKGSSSTEATDPDASPQVSPAPTPPAISDEERFPLQADAQFLNATPAFPSKKRAPVVYFGPLAPADDSSTSACKSLECMLRFQLGSSPRTQPALNVVPLWYMREPYLHEDGSCSLDKQPPSQLASDAQLLGCDYLVTGGVRSSAAGLALDLSVTDLKTSRTQKWDSEASPALFATLFGDAVRNCASSCGLNATQIDQAQLLKAIPNAATWAWWCRSGHPDDLEARPIPAEQWRAAIQADPQCTILRVIAAARTSDLAIVNDALRNTPDNLGLLLTKCELLRTKKKPFAALLLHSELVRRYPDSLLVMSELPWTLSACFPAKSDSTEPPVAFLKATEALRNLSAGFADNWLLRKDYGSVCQLLASFVRGSKTVDQVPQEAWSFYRRLMAMAVHEIDLAAARRPDCPNLLTLMLGIHFLAGDHDLVSQREVLERIHQLDPSNVEAEITVAYSHSVGWSQDAMYLPIIKGAYQRHQDSPRALAKIAQSLAENVGRTVGFGQSREEVFAKENPSTNLFIECMERSLASGNECENWVAEILMDVYQARAEKQKIRQLAAQDGRRSRVIVQAAELFQQNDDCTQCLELAREAMATAQVPEIREQLQYHIVKSLWKLARIDEGLAEAKKGIAQYPDKQTFYYLFALIALPKPAAYEEAFAQTTRAIDICSTNPAVNKVHEMLRVKLNRPPHPKLAGK